MVLSAIQILDSGGIVGRHGRDATYSFLRLRGPEIKNPPDYLRRRQTAIQELLTLRGFWRVCSQRKL